jgi:hypothetical protein
MSSVSTITKNVVVVENKEWDDLVASCKVHANWCDMDDDDEEEAAAAAAAVEAVKKVSAEEDFFSQPYVSYDWVMDDEEEMRKRDEVTSLDVSAVSRETVSNRGSRFFDLELDTILEEVEEEKVLVEEVDVNVPALDVEESEEESLADTVIKTPTPSDDGQDSMQFDRPIATFQEIDALFEDPTHETLKRLGISSYLRRSLVVRMPGPNDKLRKVSKSSRHSLDVLAWVASTQSYVSTPDSEIRTCY